MSKINDGGPAFPFAYTDQTGGLWSNDGMTLRQWYAGMALQGLMSDPGLRPDNEREIEHMAKRLFQVADAMIAAETV